MPGPIHNNAGSASAIEVEDMKARLLAMDRKLEALVNVLERRPNPAPAPAQDSNGFIMQLLLAEKENTARQAERLAELQNPLNQLDQLQALSALIPAQEDSSNSKMMEEVLSTVGAIVASKMAQGEESAGGGASDHGYAEDDSGEPR